MTPKTEPTMHLPAPGEILAYLITVAIVVGVGCLFLRAIGAL